MSIKLWEATSYNNYQSSLVTGISSNATIIYLPSGASGLVAPGILTLDQWNLAGDLTELSREYISFTTVTAGQDQVSGLTRGLGGSSATLHAQGALVEGTMTSTHWGDMIDFIQAEHIADGLHLLSTVTTNYIETFKLANTSLASIAILDISRHLNASGASISGLSEKLTVKFSHVGTITGATTALQTPIVMPKDGSWNWINIVTSSVASTASVVFDINKNGVSIFDTGTRPSIVGGGTFVSTASFSVPSFSRADQFSWDFDGPSSVGGLITNFNILLRSN